MLPTLDTSKIWDGLKTVEHPAINLSLVRLGTVHEIKLNKNVVMVLMKFPFQGIPIGEQLIQMVQDAIESRGFAVEIVVTLMGQNERQNFLALEEQYWKG